jgi:dephospho-CoA kinase
MVGSGKTTLAEMFESHGFRVVSMGNVIRNLASEKGVEKSLSNLGGLAETIREEGGEAAVAEVCIDEIRRLEEEDVVVDGVRSMFEVDAFRKSFETILVAVHASPETRFSRLRERKRSDDPCDFEGFLERDRRELGFNLGTAIAMSDHVILNNGNIGEFEEGFEVLLKRLGKK